LTDAEWAIFEPLMPTVSTTGRPMKWMCRELLDAMLYLLRGGLAWRMLPPGLFPPVGNATCKLIAIAHEALRLSQQQHAAVRGLPATVKGRRDLLALCRWKRKSPRAIVAPGGGGLWHFVPRCRTGLDANFLH